MKISIPAQNVRMDQPTGIDPIWYEKLNAIIAAINSGAIGQGKLATTATTGFGFLPTMAGAPTGVPVSPITGLSLAQYGFVPCVYDTTNNKLWVYNGAWRGVVLT